MSGNVRGVLGKKALRTFLMEIIGLREGNPHRLKIRTVWALNRYTVLSQPMLPAFAAVE